MNPREAAPHEDVKAQVLEAFHMRHACKVFDPARKIPEDDFRYILETARLSPSSFGFEPWQFVVLQNPAIREKLLPVTWGAQRTLPTASHYVLVLARTKGDLSPDGDYMTGILRDVKHLPADMLEGYRQRVRTFFESDFATWDNDRAVFEWACRQSYIALANMMTAAALIGIDSCPIEGFMQAEAERVLREEGILTGNLGLACMAAFGYRVQDPARPQSRRPMDQVVSWVE